MNDAILALQIFFTACESSIINLVHFGFFLLAIALENVRPSSTLQAHLESATVCNANIRLSREVNLMVPSAQLQPFLS